MELCDFFFLIWQEVFFLPSSGRSKPGWVSQCPAPAACSAAVNVQVCPITATLSKGCWAGRSSPVTCAALLLSHLQPSLLLRVLLSGLGRGTGWNPSLSSSRAREGFFPSALAQVAAVWCLRQCRLWWDLLWGWCRHYMTVLSRFSDASSEGRLCSFSFSRRCSGSRRSPSQGIMPSDSVIQKDEQLLY